MTNDSLIEKLEALKPKSKSGTSFEMDTEWLAIDNCIGVVKDHFASEISVVDDNYMTVVFDRSVVNFDKNPMHIKSKFGNVVAISRGDALAKLDEATREPVMRVDGSTRKDDLRGEKPEESGAIAPATSTEQPVDCTNGHSFGRTDGYGGSTCQKCGKYKAATQPPMPSIIAFVAKALEKVIDDSQPGEPWSYEKLAYAAIAAEIDYQAKDEVEHMESCECCQAFLAMEKKYDELEATKRESVDEVYDEALQEAIALEIQNSLESEENYWQAAAHITEKFDVRRKP